MSNHVKISFSCDTNTSAVTFRQMDENPQMSENPTVTLGWDWKMLIGELDESLDSSSPTTLEGSTFSSNFSVIFYAYKNEYIVIVITTAIMLIVYFNTFVLKYSDF